MKRQRGGTFLGFILGVVVGLGAALAVAVYVTKVPVPFVNKGQSRTPEQDAAEARRNKDWDPNVPLQGKGAARAAGNAAEQTPLPARVEKPEAKTDAKAENKPAAPADPLGDLVNKVASAEPFVYFVQVGAFRTPEDAESMRAKLSLSGVDAKVWEREQSGRMVYRVRIGPIDKRDEADKLKERLSAGGQDAVLVRVQR